MLRGIGSAYNTHKLVGLQKERSKIYAVAGCVDIITKLVVSGLIQWELRIINRDYLLCVCYLQFNMWLKFHCKKISFKHWMDICSKFEMCFEYMKFRIVLWCRIITLVCSDNICLCNNSWIVIIVSRLVIY